MRCPPLLQRVLRLIRFNSRDAFNRLLTETTALVIGSSVIKTDLNVKNVHKINMNARRRTPQSFYENLLQKLIVKLNELLFSVHETDNI